MCGKEPDRKPGSGRPSAAAAFLGGLAAASLAAAAPARAGEGLWDTALETMNLKAPAAAASPAFVERTRPDPAGLGYMPTALPHKVSPLPVKSADEVQAQKDALDAAKQRQLDPGAPRPLQTAKGKPSAKGKSSPGVAD